MNYVEALAYLDTLNTFGIRLGLERIERLLALMDHPERKYKTIHVTGTNGKGSTTAMLAEILKCSGIRAGMYTSPHLIEYTERMKIDGQPISYADFAQAIEVTSRFVAVMVNEGGESPTQFEVLTAAAFYYFAVMNVEYAVIEVGLGGLLDSTNVIVPEIAVITNVELEHTDRCGTTVAAIAKHKAGIIKTKVPVVTAAKDEALSVLSQKSQHCQSPLYVFDQDFGAQYEQMCGYRQQVAYWTKAGLQVDTALLNLFGQHQVENSALAVQAAAIVAEREERITAEAIVNGLQQVVWPGRCEIIEGIPTIVIDGAHNPAGAKALRKALDRLFPEKRITFLLGILHDKDIYGITKALVTRIDEVVVTRPDSERAASPAEVADAISAQRVETVPVIEEALATARNWSKGADNIVCVAGSLYLIGTVRQILSK